ncbi:uncharacterized protein LOC142498793 isoform X2 [Ascaphus truei]|uniref:uncharacterized protein LOC142498793 isoform X2 n=1 Tax=Ascaphus truei TaxID=8439 RepID=UPI003F5A940C
MEVTSWAGTGHACAEAAAVLRTCAKASAVLRACTEASAVVRACAEATALLRTCAKAPAVLRACAKGGGCLTPRMLRSGHHTPHMCKRGRLTPRIRRSRCRTPCMRRRDHPTPHVLKGKHTHRRHTEGAIHTHTEGAIHTPLLPEELQKGKPFELAVDVGCGTGRYTRPLAVHFEKVIGIDLSESQINEARRSTSEENVLYHTSSAEEMPLKDASVDLVFAGLAAHWFILDKFMQEAARVLKPGGCLALHAFHLKFEIQYQDVSETLTAIITETMNVLFKYGDKSNDVMMNQYRELFEAVPFADKQRG